VNAPVDATECLSINEGTYSSIYGDFIFSWFLSWVYVTLCLSFIYQNMLILLISQIFELSYLLKFLVCMPFRGISELQLTFCLSYFKAVILLPLSIAFPLIMLTIELYMENFYSRLESSLIWWFGCSRLCIMMISKIYRTSDLHSLGYWTLTLLIFSVQAYHLFSWRPLWLL